MLFILIAGKLMMAWLITELKLIIEQNIQRMNFSLLLYKTQTVKSYKRHRKLFLKESASYQ